MQKISVFLALLSVFCLVQAKENNGNAYGADAPPGQKVKDWMQSQPAGNEGAMNVKKAMAFLRHYGYLPEDPDDDTTFEEFEEAVKGLQKLLGEEQTGKLNKKTMDKGVNGKRCGNSDRGISAKRNTRATVNYRTWNSRFVTYKVVSYTSDISPQSDIDWVFEQALEMWSNETSLVFIKSQCLSADVDIEISFQNQVHGTTVYDGDFDGQLGTLAHAFYPEPIVIGLKLGGDIHFDEDENWVKTSEEVDVANDDISLLSVMAHELGHALGIQHSGNEGALMYPYYDLYEPMEELGQDDKDAIKLLYGDRCMPHGIPDTCDGVTNTIPSTPSTCTR